MCIALGDVLVEQGVKKIFDDTVISLELKPVWKVMGMIVVLRLPHEPVKSKVENARDMAGTRMGQSETDSLDWTTPRIFNPRS